MAAVTLASRIFVFQMQIRRGRILATAGVWVVAHTLTTVAAISSSLMIAERFSPFGSNVAVISLVAFLVIFGAALTAPLNADGQHA